MPSIDFSQIAEPPSMDGSWDEEMAVMAILGASEALCERLVELISERSKGQMVDGELQNELGSIVEIRRLIYDYVERRDRVAKTKLARLKIKLCERCKARFFFAQTANGKWMPLEEDQLVGRDVPVNRRYIVTIDADDKPQVRVNRSAKGSAPVWVNHLMTCGASLPDFEGSEAIERRWRVNAARCSVAAEGVVKGLLALKRELEES